MSTVETTPRAVSEEDREAAIDVAYDAADAKHDKVHQPHTGCCNVVGITEAVDALISHGWGPKPVIYCETVLDHVSTSEAATSLIDVLLRNGIEVRD